MVISLYGLFQSPERNPSYLVITYFVEFCNIIGKIMELDISHILL